jgi:hypothetical protein
LPEMFTCFRKNSHITVQKIELTVIGFPLTQQKQGRTIVNDMLRPGAVLQTLS